MAQPSRRSLARPSPRRILLAAGFAAIALHPLPSRAACAHSALPADAPLAVVLSGGGAKGAYEAGVAVAFLRRGLTIKLAAGSSAGALNAAMLADGRADKLEAHWKGLSRDQVYRLRPAVGFAGLLPGWLTLWALDSAGSLFDPEPLRQLLTASLDLERIRASATRVLVLTTDLSRREPRIFDNQTLTVDALMAATAVPGAFPPVLVQGALLVDGGLIGRAPVLETLEAGVPVGRVVVVMSYAPDERGERPTTMRRTLEGAFEMSMIHQVLRDTELARLKYPGVEVQLLTPSAPVLMRPLDFDPEGLARLLERGQADALACLAAWEGR
jgi:NTE family protein